MTFRELFGLWQNYEDEFARLGDWMDVTEKDIGELLMTDDLTGRQGELLENTMVEHNAVFFSVLALMIKLIAHRLTSLH